VIDKPSSPRGSPTPQNVNRPLPQIPSRKSSLKHRRNVSSVSTNAPSVAASLKSYIDRDSPSPEPAEIGIAEAVDVRLTSQVVGTTEWSGDTGSNQSLPVDEQSSNSPLSEIATKRQGMALSSLSTEPVTFSLPNVTIRKLRLSGGKHSPLRKTSPAKDEFQRKDENSPLLDNQVTLALTESEWMCRTPSPMKKSQEEDGFPLTKLWSPGLGANRKSLRRGSEGSVESAGSVSRRRASILDHQATGIPEEDADNAARQEFDDELIRSGNWIWRVPFRLWRVFPLDCAGKDGVGCEMLAFRHFYYWQDQRCFSFAIVVDAMVVEMYESNACDVDILGLRKETSKMNLGSYGLRTAQLEGRICNNR
jgi:hypothetical protein